MRSSQPCSNYLEIPAAANRVIQSLRVYDDPPCGREVQIEFDDGTELFIELQPVTRVRTRHCRTDAGDMEILSEYGDASSSETP